MLGFVVQNYYSPQNFLVKTKRYLTLNKQSMSRLYTMFIKSTMYLTFNGSSISTTKSVYMNLFLIYTAPTFWKIFNGIDHREYGLVTNNITRSAQWHTIASLTLPITNPEKNLKEFIPQPSFVSRQLLKPVPVLGFAFHKRTHDTIMIYVIHFLLFNYFSPRTFFKLSYSYILLHANLSQYMFCNCFYFKIRNH